VLVLGVVMAFMRIGWMMTVIVRVGRVIIPERNTFEIRWWSSYRFSLAKCDVVRGFTFKYQKCRLRGGE
jgi:hypothetical protein